jgi:hypothetical protein
MDGANNEARFVKVWASKGPFWKLGPIITMVNYGT